MENTLLEELIRRCWFDTIGLAIEPLKTDMLDPADNFIISTIVFTGQQQGSLTLMMSEKMANMVAGKMFDHPLETVSYDDIRDSLGELANVLAGNLKARFFGSSELSKPVVMQGGNSLIDTFLSDAIFQKVFSSFENERLLVQVCQAR